MPCADGALYIVRIAPIDPSPGGAGESGAYLLAAEYCVGAIMMPKLPESDLLLEEEPDRSLASLEADI